MFGYLKPDNPYLYIKDEVLYKSLYCSVCKSIGKNLSQASRFSLTYDIAFMSALVHNIMGVDVNIQKKHCVTHPIKKIPVAEMDEITKKLSAVNVILAKYKVSDDITDEKKGKVKNLFLIKGYKKAKKLLPKVDDIVKNGYQNLRKLELENSSSVDIVSNCFAEILQDISEVILENKKTEFTSELFYLIGKWIYLIDAVDDYDKDIKKGSYNVFYNLYKLPDYNSVKNQKISDINFIFNGIFMRIPEVLQNIKFCFNKDLIINVIARGIPQTTNKIINKEIK